MPCWPLAQCVLPQLRRCLKESAASQEDEGRLLSMIQALTDADLTWQKRVWLSGLCYHSGKACVANKAREVLAQGDLSGLLKWQLQGNVGHIDLKPLTFAMICFAFAPLPTTV